jgi:hypothetical protein
LDERFGAEYLYDKSWPQLSRVYLARKGFEDVEDVEEVEEEVVVVVEPNRRKNEVG